MENEDIASSTDRGEAPTKPNYWLIALGHGLVALASVGLFVSLVWFEPPPFFDILRGSVLFGLAAAGIVLVRQKESFPLTAAVAGTGCAIWLLLG